MKNINQRLTGIRLAGFQFIKVCLTVSICLFFCTTAYSAVIDAIVAVVDDHIIMKSELDAKVKELGLKADDKASIRKVLELMAQDVIVEKEYQKYGIAKPDTNQITRFMAENKVSYDRARIALMRNSLMNMMVRSRVVVTPGMIQSYYKKNTKFQGEPSLKMKQILIKNDKEKALKAVSELKAGKSFDDIAAVYSDEPKLISMGWVAPADLADGIRTTLENGKKGAIVGPLQLKDYWCIFLIEDVGVEGKKNLEEVREEIEGTLETKYREEAFEYWFKQMSAEHFVGIYN